MRHGNEKTEFETGAHRDTAEGKGTPSLISPILIHRLGVLLEEGAKHYGTDNWRKGMPYRRVIDSMIRHTFLELAGDKEEDHLAAIVFGCMCLMTYKSDKVLDQKLDDRDEGLKKILPSLLTPTPPKPRLERDVREQELSTPSKWPTKMQPCKGSCGGMTVWEDGYCQTCTVRGENPNHVCSQ